MKISKIIKQTKEYQRLSDLIQNIEKAIKDFDRINTVDANTAYVNGTITLGGGILCDTSDSVGQPNKTRVDVYLNSEVSEMVRNDVKTILRKLLTKLKKQKNALEV